MAAEVLAVGLLASGSVAYASSNDRPNAGHAEGWEFDTDGDGLLDAFEQTGWLTQNGSLHVTDPTSADSDGDGLSDRDEAGKVVLCTAAGYVYSGFSDPQKHDTDDDGLEDAEESVLGLDPWDADSDGDQLTDGHEVHTLLTAADKPDTDGDGLADGVEVLGWATQSGATYITDPTLNDTDGDGLWDSDESGTLVISEITGNVYAGFSNPLVSDTDGDGADDATEADAGIDPLDSDSDSDGLEDGQELNVLGTAPDTADTDGDGFDDGYEDENRGTQGLDPLWADVKVDKLAYAVSFARGAVLGDVAPEDSIAWLAGNLASGASTSVPVVGTLVGTVADVRDAVGSAIHADWVTAGFAVVGIAPIVGDAVELQGKTATFIARNKTLASEVGDLIVAQNKLPDAVKIKVGRWILPGWDELRRSGASDQAILELKRGKTNLETLAATAKSGASAPTRPRPGFMATGPEGEAFLAKSLGVPPGPRPLEARMSTEGCGAVCGTNLRIADVIVGGVAHESKVGRIGLSEFIKAEAEKDAFLVRTKAVSGVHWHFYASSVSNTIGPTPQLLDHLNKLGIPYTIHLP